MPITNLIGNLNMKVVSGAAWSDYAVVFVVVAVVAVVVVDALILVDFVDVGQIMYDG